MSWGQQFIEMSGEVGVEHYSLHRNQVCGGVVLFDLNNDDFVDIYATGGEVGDHLYLNNGDGTFTDITEFSGLGLPDSIITCGATSGDYDADGFVDLFVTTEKNYRSYLFRNNGDSSFSDVSMASGIDDKKLWSSSATFVDINIDGKLDLYVGNYLKYSGFPYYFNIGLDDSLRANYLYINQGGGVFEDEAEAYGINAHDATLAVGAFDLNGDYRPDLFDGNDFGHVYGGNEVWFNLDGFPNLIPAARSIGLYREIQCMGVAVGDYNGDLIPDVYFSDFFDNHLYSGLDSCHQYKSVTLESKIDNLGFMMWGTAMLDFNNDSYLDVATASGTIVSDYKAPTQVYLNNQDGTFEKASDALGFTHETYGRGLAYGDLDNDGDMDIVVAPVSKSSFDINPLLIYYNMGNGNDWTMIKLRGSQSANLQGYHSTIYFYLSNGRKLVRHMDGGSSFLSQNQSIVHLGLGNPGLLSIDSLEIVWPGGKAQMEREVLINQVNTYSEEIDPAKYYFYEVTVDTACFRRVSNDTTALLASTQSQTHIYPNPFVNRLKISTPVSGSEIIVYDATGRPVHQSFSELKSTVIDLGHLPQGMYLLNIITGRQTHRYRMIKK